MFKKMNDAKNLLKNATAKMIKKINYKVVGKHA